jgi:hypothetical protein
MDSCGKLVDNVSSKDGIVGELNVNNVESYEFSLHGCSLVEGYIYISFADSFDFLSAEAN